MIPTTYANNHNQNKSKLLIQNCHGDILPIQNNNDSNRFIDQIAKEIEIVD